MFFKQIPRGESAGPGPAWVMKTSGVRSRARVQEARVPLIQFPKLHVRIKTILVPIDFSPGSRRALAHALPLAALFHARMVLVHVVKPVQELVDCGYGEVVRFWPDEAMIHRSGEHLRAMARCLKKPAVKLDTAVRSGEPGREIVEAAKETGADLIVIGTRGVSADQRDLMGSTAERVAREAGCPVLVVRQKEHDFVEVPAPRRSGRGAKVAGRMANPRPGWPGPTPARRRQPE